MLSWCPSGTKTMNYIREWRQVTLVPNMDTITRIMVLLNSLITEYPDCTCWESMPRWTKTASMKEEGIRKYHMQPCWWLELLFPLLLPLPWVKLSPLAPGIRLSEGSLRMPKGRKSLFWIISSSRIKSYPELQKLSHVCSARGKSATLPWRCLQMPKREVYSLDWMKHMLYPVWRRQFTPMRLWGGCKLWDELQEDMVS